MSALDLKQEAELHAPTQEELEAEHVAQRAACWARRQLPLFPELAP